MHTGGKLQYIACKRGSDLEFQGQSWPVAAVYVKAHELTCLSLSKFTCEVGIMVPMSFKCMNT